MLVLFMVKRSRLPKSAGGRKTVRMPRVEFAPDGIHYQTIKSGALGKMWDYFTQNPDVRQQLLLNPQAKFRLVGEEKVIGVLVYDRAKKEFVHLKGD
jgi:hypothetical protein